jgi:SnoaL-like domain
MSDSQSSRFLTADDRLDIIQRVTGIGFFADIGEWDSLADCYAESVTVDYTRLMDGEPMTMDRGALVDFFKSSLTQWDAAQHLITNVQIQPESADVVGTSAHEYTVQVFKTRLWTIAGYFTHRLRRTSDGWKITAQTLHPLFDIDPTGVKAEWMAGMKN